MRKTSRADDFELYRSFILLLHFDGMILDPAAGNDFTDEDLDYIAANAICYRSQSPKALGPGGARVGQARTE